MPGWYIHMDVARKAVDGLPDNPRAAPIFAAGGPSADAVRAIGRANPSHVALGAIGPDIFFMLPDFKPPLGSMLWKLANTVRELFTDWDEIFLGPYESALGPIGDNLADETNALTGGLKDEIEAIFGQATKFLKNFVLKLILEQYDFFGILSSGLQSAFDEQTFFWSDMFHYRETYRFGAELWKRASETARRWAARALPGVCVGMDDAPGYRRHRSRVRQREGGWSLPPALAAPPSCRESYGLPGLQHRARRPGYLPGDEQRRVASVVSVQSRRQLAQRLLYA